MARILVVDDAAFMRGSLEFILKNAGHEVVGTGRDGSEAIELYRKLKPDLITMDILMKDMDGLTALKVIKGEFPDAKVVMITALGQESKAKEAERLGAAGYMKKPFKQEEIVEVVERVTGKSGSGPGA